MRNSVHRRVRPLRPVGLHDDAKLVRGREAVGVRHRAGKLHRSRRADGRALVTCDGAAGQRITRLAADVQRSVGDRGVLKNLRDAVLRLAEPRAREHEPERPDDARIDPRDCGCAHRGYGCAQVVLALRLRRTLRNEHRHGEQSAGNNRQFRSGIEVGGAGQNPRSTRSTHLREDVDAVVRARDFIFDQHPPTERDADAVLRRERAVGRSRQCGTHTGRTVGIGVGWQGGGRGRQHRGGVGRQGRDRATGASRTGELGRAVNRRHH